MKQILQVPVCLIFAFGMIACGSDESDPPTAVSLLT